MNKVPSKFDMTRLDQQAAKTAATVNTVRGVVKAVSLNAIIDDASDREFVFTEKDFARVRKMILDEAGISLAPSKQSMVYSRLARRLRATGHAKFSIYLDSLEDSKSNPEWEHFTNALTTNLTSFYREAHHFDILKRQLQGLKRQGVINIWCSAASTGEEPYTLAITAMEAFNSMNPPVRIVATDIDTKVLDHARKGIYKMDQVDKVPPEILKKYFLRGKGESEGLIRVRPELQSILTFKRLNLMEPNWMIKPGLDAIFCRNVMIYFEKDVQFQILKRFAPLMNAGAYLYAGHSENFGMARDFFTLKGKTVYVVNDDKCSRLSTNDMAAGRNLA